MIQRKRAAFANCLAPYARLPFPNVMPSKSNRKSIAHFAVALMLLCQTAALAQACAGGVAQTAPAVTLAPCHDTGAAADASDTIPDACQSRCLSQAAKVSDTLPDVPALAGLPGLVVYGNLDRTETAGSAGVFDPRPRGEPPPLTILCCRLLN